MSIYRTNVRPEYCFQHDTRAIARMLGLSGYSCTLLNKHKGPHTAEGSKTPVIYYWPGGIVEVLLREWGTILCLCGLLLLVMAMLFGGFIHSYMCPASI